jgi:hypothetical protein
LRRTLGFAPDGVMTRKRFRRRSLSYVEELSTEEGPQAA